MLLLLFLDFQDKKEKVLCKLRERHGLVDQINLDLTYAVCFNLANSYHQNGMKKEVTVIIVNSTISSMTKQLCIPY